MSDRTSSANMGRRSTKMVRIGVRLALFAAAASAGLQMVAQQQQESPPVLPTLSPPPPPPWIFVSRPDPLPSPPDAPVPDLGTLPVRDSAKSRLQRVIDRLAPRCLDAATHTCWSSPPEEDSLSASQADREFAKDMEVGNFNFKNKNYKGAKLRFQDALNHKLGDPEATFKLAESLDKLGENEAGKAMYEGYLKVQPNGLYAERARKAIQRLDKKSAHKD